MPLFVYNLGIPDAPNNPSDDQPKMQTNTNSIDSLISIDHYSFNDSSGGFHIQSTYPSLVAGPTTTATQGAVYTKTSGGQVDLFYRRQSNGDEWQMTMNVPIAVVNNANGAGSITYFTFLPNGFKVAMGSTANSVDGGSLTLSTTFSTLVSVQLTALGTSQNDPDRPVVVNPKTVNAGAGTMSLLIRDTNNNPQTNQRVVYFYVVGF